MQIAIQNGLHVFGNGQDFARTVLWPDESERAFRAQLWAYCLFTCQRYDVYKVTRCLLTIYSAQAFAMVYHPLW